MAFAQMTYRESLRDIEACLGAQPSKLPSSKIFVGDFWNRKFAELVI
jgi:hypothetical protein